MPSDQERIHALLFDLRRPVEAERAILDALTREPNSGWLYAVLAEARRRQGKLVAAEADARTAIGLAPEFDYAHNTLANILYDQERYTIALKPCAEALRLAPENPDYHETMALLLLGLERNKKARQSAEQGLKFDPEHVGCLNRLAVALRLLDYPEQAQAALERALQIDPEAAQTYASLGWLARNTLQYRTAIRHYREALRLDPTEPHASTGLRDTVMAFARLVGLAIIACTITIGVAIRLTGLFEPWLSNEAHQAIMIISTNGGIGLALMILFSHTGRVAVPGIIPAGRALLAKQDSREIAGFLVLVGILVAMTLSPHLFDVPNSFYIGATGLILVVDTIFRFWRSYDNHQSRSRSS